MAADASLNGYGNYVLAYFRLINNDGEVDSRDVGTLVPNRQPTIELGFVEEGTQVRAIGDGKDRHYAVPSGAIIVSLQIGDVMPMSFAQHMKEAGRNAYRDINKYQQENFYKQKPKQHEPHHDIKQLTPVVVQPEEVCQLEMSVDVWDV